jgi:class 3 adenylate cyclase
MARLVSELSWDSFTPRQILHEFFVKEGNQFATYEQMRFGAWLRLTAIAVLTYLPTGLDVYHSAGSRGTPEAEGVITVWFLGLGAWFLATLGLLLLPAERSRRLFPVAWSLTLVCLALEIFTNQLVNYAYGSTSSHTPMFLVLIVIVYRCFFGYLLGLCAVLLSVGMFGGEILLQAAGWLPPHPFLDIPLASAEAIARRQFFVTQSVIVCITLAFMLANLSMNQVARLHRYITESVLQRYLPPALVRRAARGELSLDGDPERRIVTIMFTDLVGFTPLSEELGPERLGKVLNRYLSEVSMLAHDHGATVDKFIGDAVMILFGAPDKLPPEEQAERAMHLARAIHEVVQTIDTGVGRTLQARTGVNTGEVVLGSFGSPQRSDYTVLGPAVNIAARLESASRPGRVLLGEATARLLVDAPLFSAGHLQLKGVPQPVEGFFLDRDPTEEEEAPV